MSAVQTLKNEEKIKFEEMLNAPATDAPLRVEENSSAICSTSGSSWGTILIGIGAIFLLSNIFGSALVNWWGFFILWFAYRNLSFAISSYRAQNGLGGKAQDSLGWGIFWVIVGGMALLNLSWSVFWPLLLVGWGFSFILKQRYAIA